MVESTDRITPAPAEGDAAVKGTATPVLPPGRARTPAAPAADRRPARTERARTNGRPSSPEEMRREIDRTRARMSDTLDALEARILHEKEALARKKESFVSTVTLRGVRRTLAREPWRSMAIAFAAGYIIAAIRD